MHRWSGEEKCMSVLVPMILEISVDFHDSRRPTWSLIYSNKTTKTTISDVWTPAWLEVSGLSISSGLWWWKKKQDFLWLTLVNRICFWFLSKICPFCFVIDCNDHTVIRRKLMSTANCSPAVISYVVSPYEQTFIQSVLVLAASMKQWARNRAFTDYLLLHTTSICATNSTIEHTQSQITQPICAQRKHAT